MRRVRRRAAAGLAAAARAHAPASGAPCPRGWLPAYAHNDYANPRPLAGALALGYRGAEADVFLVGGALRVAHGRRQAMGAPTFEALYLAPLRALAARCGRLVADGSPFLLTVELKESSRPAYDSLAALLGRYATLLTPGDARDGTRAPLAVAVVLVGWHLGRAVVAAASPRLAGVQARLVAPDRPVPADPAGLVRLVSLDYGKTMGRPWVTARGRRRWLAALRAARRADPGRLVRVYNLPPDARLYRELRAAGADLVGTKSLRPTAAALAR